MQCRPLCTRKMSARDATSTPPPRQKSGPSARRGKQQREKRMLRQKRRSTGVVRLQESDDENDKKDTKKSENKDVVKQEETETKDEEVLYISETEKNTLSNEVSPLQRDTVYTESSSSRYTNYEAREHSSSILKQSSLSPRSAYSSHSQHTSDSVFTTGESSPSPQNTTMPALNSSRRRGKRSSTEKGPQEMEAVGASQDKQEVEELRRKLASAESTVTKLTQEIESMDTDLRSLEEENSRLKKENKMLEDENLTMLRLMKR